MARVGDAGIDLAKMTPNERFEGAFCISNAQIGKTRTDKPYLRCILGDATGRAPGRMWGADDSVMNRLPADGFVWVRGETQPYQGELQLIMHAVDPFNPSGEEMRALLPASERDPEEMFAELSELMRSVEHPAAKALVETYLADERLMDAFKSAPAAKMMHHAYLGGLLEHTLSLVKGANFLLPLYPDLNRDVVLIGLMLHDIAKTHELSWDASFEYTERGMLVGHIVDGVVILHDKAQEAMREHGMRFPPHFITCLQHIILSHHGLPEYGAAKQPATPEAIFVSQLDELDAKVFQGVAAAKRGATGGDGEVLRGNFTEKVWGLDVKLFRPDPLA